MVVGYSQSKFMNKKNDILFLNEMKSVLSVNVFYSYIRLKLQYFVVNLYDLFIRLV